MTIKIGCNANAFTVHLEVRVEMHVLLMCKAVPAMRHMPITQPIAEKIIIK
jgi:hypothetical protein